MPRRGHAYITLDVNFVRDALDVGLTANAIALYVGILGDCKARRLDGIFSRQLARQLGVPGYWHSLKLLIKWGYVHDLGEERYKVVAWEKWNEPAKDIAARQEADRQRKRIVRSIPRGAFRVPD